MGAWTEIVDFTFTANETSKPFTGLNITKDDFIKVVVSNVNGSSSFSTPGITRGIGSFSSFGSSGSKPKKPKPYQMYSQKW
jgi:hypothetical protein